MTDEELVRLAGLLGWDTVNGSPGWAWADWGENDEIRLVEITTWEGAGAVVEAMRALGYTWDASSDPWEASFFGEGNLFGSRSDNNFPASLPEAIARAALAALGGAG